MSLGEGTPSTIHTRREFCGSACKLGSAAAFLSIFEACGGSPTGPSDAAPSLASVPGTIVNGAVVVSINPGSPLASVGGAAIVQASTSNFLVARTGQAAFTALTAICTHEGCTVTGFTNQVYVCPCHGSRYNTNGSVAQGPATQALRQFPTQFVNDVLTISI
jgi:cytochrome b6-f complex iron-sulfur subunit